MPAKRYSTQIKPSSYLKANAAEVLQELAGHRKLRDTSTEARRRTLLELERHLTSPASTVSF